ncbi:MAG: type IV pilus assembly protein PilM [Armatimonadota bacterium]
MPLKKSGGPVVGLDIGSATIKACELDIRGGKANLRGIAVLPTPEGAVVNDEIIDPVALGKSIGQVFKQAGIKARKVVTCVSGNSSLVVRIIEVPKMTRAELQETMKWEIERHVPFAAEQVVMDYQPLVAPEEVADGQNMEVLLAVAQEASVMRHLEALQAAGLKAVAIDIEPLAQSRSLIDLANGAGPEGTVALVDIGASTTDIGIYKDGRIAFTRTIQLAGNNLTKAISDVLGQPLAEAERLKRELGGVPDQPRQDAGTLDDGLGDFPGLDFGDAPDLGNLGGTFGAAPGQATATATDTHAEPEYDVAGAGFSPEAFTTPSGEANPAASPFDAPPADLSGPAPAGNPFEVPAEEPAAGAAPAGGFDASLFGPAPGADPFAPVDDFPAFGAPGGAPAASAAPEAMSEEEYLRTQIADAIMPVLHELVTELRRSLDFYRNRANGLGAQQVVITGGTAKLPGLADFLRANLEVPVAVGDPLKYLATGPKTDPNYLSDIGPVFPVSVGLAVRELLVDTAPARKKR